MIPILIVGTMGSGKTIVADYLVNEYKYKKHSMAYWLKHTIMLHYGLDKIDKDMIINDKTMRKLMQELGNYMRKIDIKWHIDEVIRRLKECKHEDLFVIDDIRFINELNSFTEFKPISIKIVSDERTRLERIILRDMIVPSETEIHDVSEIDIIDMVTDFTIDNNKDKVHLFDNIDRIMRSELDEYWVRHYRNTD